MSQTENQLPEISSEENQEQNEISMIRDSLIRTEKGQHRQQYSELQDRIGM